MTFTRRIRELEQYLAAEFNEFERVSVAPEQLTILTLPDNGRGPDGPLKEPVEHRTGNCVLRIYPAVKCRTTWKGE